MKHFRPRFQPRGTPRLIYFADGVAIPKRTAVRLVMFELILNHAEHWEYAVAERTLARCANPAKARKTAEINGIETAGGLIWAQEQWPKPKKRSR